MSDDFTTLSLRYLLGELEPAERSAFEARLEREPAAAAAFKTCADAMGRFGLERGWEDSLTEDEQQVNWTELKLRLAEDDLLQGSPAGSPRRWRTYLWPMAAAVLLGLNLWQWMRPRAGGIDSNLSTRVADGRGLDHYADGAARVGDNAPHLDPARPEVALHPGPLKLNDPWLVADLQRLEALRREYQALQKDRDALAKEYGQIVNQLIPSSVAETGAGRLVAMELVDQASYESGDRNGLLMKAKALLTAPGLVAVPSPSASGSTTGPSVTHDNSEVTKDSVVVDSGSTNTTPSAATTASSGTTAPTSTGTVATTTTATTTSSGNVETAAPTGTSSVTMITSGQTLPLTTTPVTSVNYTDGATSTTETTTAPSSSASPSSAAPSSSTSTSTAPSAATESTAPYAWSVYDDTAHQGYLNLYNLPTVSTGTVLELWIMPAGSDQFQAVGQVPSQFYGQSGSLYYQLPATTTTPSQVLITVESGTSGTPKAPSGTVVLRGP